MSKWTREQAIREAVARGWCDPANSHKEMDSILAESIVREVLALDLTARSEGFREGVEAAAMVCKKAADDLYEFAEEQRKVGQARVAADNESKAATAKVLENHIRALSPRETDVSGDRQ